MEMEPEQEVELHMPEESGDNSGKAPAEGRRSRHSWNWKRSTVRVMAMRILRWRRIRL